MTDPTVEAQLELVKSPMIFLRIGWMDRYCGASDGDTISRGGAYVAQHGFGHEIFNFQSYEEYVYGYVQPPGRKENWKDATIYIDRLGASPGQKSMSGVLAVWVATLPTGGAVVVGWYKNATVYRTWQSPPIDSARSFMGVDCGYFVSASAADAFLLAPDARLFPIPQQIKGGFGRSNIWYADDLQQHQQFRMDIQSYVTTQQIPDSVSRDGSTRFRQPDPFLRQKVEQIAIVITTEHFSALGYRVDSVERDNVGWDLNAVSRIRQLKLEVKGLSGASTVIELTPREFSAMQQNRDSYRLCVVTSALTAARLEVFAYSLDSGLCESEDHRVLGVQEIVGARCAVTRPTPNG